MRNAHAETAQNPAHNHEATNDGPKSIGSFSQKLEQDSILQKKEMIEVTGGGKGISTPFLFMRSSCGGSMPQ